MKSSTKGEEVKRSCTETEVKLIREYITKKWEIREWSEKELNSFYVTESNLLWYLNDDGRHYSGYWICGKLNITFKKPINEEIKTEETKGDKTMRNLTDEQKVKLILENFTNADGTIDLRDLDFGDRVVYLSRIKAKRIYNDDQEAEMIDNDGQEAETIRSDNQVILSRYSRKSKEELIKIILELEENN